LRVEAEIIRSDHQ